MIQMDDDDELNMQTVSKNQQHNNNNNNNNHTLHIQNHINTIVSIGLNRIWIWIWIEWHFGRLYRIFILASENVANNKQIQWTWLKKRYADLLLPKR